MRLVVLRSTTILAGVLLLSFLFTALTIALPWIPQAVMDDSDARMLLAAAIFGVYYQLALGAARFWERPLVAFLRQRYIATMGRDLL